MPFVVKLKAKFFDIDKFLNIDSIITPAIHSSNYGGGLLLRSQFPVRSAA